MVDRLMIIRKALRESPMRLID